MTFTNGIDVSHHQGLIDWGKVSAAGVSYAFIKATQGAAFVDARFAANWEAAGDSGITRGAYHFFDPSVPASLQFENFRSHVALAPGDLAPVLDLETDGQNWEALAPPRRIRSALELLERLEAHYGVVPVIYTNKRTIEEVFGRNPGELAKYPLWIASYKKTPPPTLPHGWSEWAYWQHTDSGTIDGISGPVDLNRCLGEPGPAIRRIEPALTRDLPVSPEMSAAAAGRHEHLEAFERIWRSVHAQAATLTPGISDMSVAVRFERDGRSSIRAHVRFRDAARLEGPGRTG